MGKEKMLVSQRFLLFLQCFQKTAFLEFVKVGIFLVKDLVCFQLYYFYTSISTCFFFFSTIKSISLKAICA